MFPIVPVPIAEWQCPAWATSTAPLDLSVAHSRVRPVAGLLTDAGNVEPTTVDVRLVQVDRIEVGDHGDVRVVRGAPIVSVEEHRFSLDGAADLADALTELLGLARSRS